MSLRWWRFLKADRRNHFSSSWQVSCVILCARVAAPTVFTFCVLLLHRPSVFSLSSAIDYIPLLPRPFVSTFSGVLPRFRCRALLFLRFGRLPFGDILRARLRVRRGSRSRAFLILLLNVLAPCGSFSTFVYNKRSLV